VRYRALKWEDIDLKESLIRIPDSKIGDPRILPMINRVKGIFMERAHGLPNTLVFCTKTGNRILTTNVGRAFRQALKKQSLRDFRFHDLRHVFATRAVDKGIDIITLKELLGHKTLAMVARYDHVTLPSKRKAIAKIGR
jgi:integrase